MVQAPQPPRIAPSTSSGREKAATVNTTEREVAKDIIFASAWNNFHNGGASTARDSLEYPSSPFHLSRAPATDPRAPLPQVLTDLKQTTKVLRRHLLPLALTGHIPISGGIANDVL